jgi:hypothetical protein
MATRLEVLSALAWPSAHAGGPDGHPRHQFEMWLGKNGPTLTQLYTLLKEGAPPLNKSFVTWFH